MASLALIIWMSVTSAVLYGIGPELWLRHWAHVAVQASCLLAASVQAGHMETGRDSWIRRPSQAMAVAAFVAHVCMGHPAMAAAVRSLTY